ncbi:Regulator of sigma-E protease RseP [Candidatus Providencia siddallii]|uniref:Zinc metalloprotease n=1 Tax=Candidatus Providencia siddallii TaxID=1715285 RepID=A0A0M6W8T1_9GAMM|nr:Regulator of sigma-E protease RseP [Candidatus Providencia siddallii]
MELILNITLFIITLSILITVHEFGHYLVARRCGVHIERFSIGFGKILFSKINKNCTEFILAIIPLGGYIKMLDERIDYVIHEKRHMAFNNKTICQKAAIVSAGPIANFLLAVIVYWIVYLIGAPTTRLIIENIKPGSIAEAANFTPKMEIISINDIEMHDWNSVKIALTSKTNNNLFTIKVIPKGYNKTITKTINLTKHKFNQEKQNPIFDIGIIPILTKINYIVKKIEKETPGERAGLMINDKIVNINGKQFNNFNLITDIIRDNPGVPLKLTVNRDNKLISLILIPDNKKNKNNKQIGFAGIKLSILNLSDKYIKKDKYGFFTAFYKAIEKTWQLISLIVKMVYKIFIGDIKINNLGGPISIAKGAGVSAKLGIVYYLIFIAFISVNLGVINLLPLSILDGGHLFFLIIEKIKGSPVSEQIHNISFKIGLIALILLIGISIFNDFSMF